MKYLKLIVFFACSALLADDKPIQPFLSVGYGQQNFCWEMQNAAEIADCFTSVEWKNLQTLNGCIGFKIYPFSSQFNHPGQHYWLTASAEWGEQIASSSFDGQFRAVELFSTPLTIKTDKTHYRLNDYTLLLGHDFFCYERSVILTSVLGFSCIEQRFSRLKGDLSIPEALADELTRLSIRNFDYHARWYKLSSGLQWCWCASDKTTLLVKALYHVGFFQGHGRWQINEQLTDGLFFSNAAQVRQSGLFQGICGNLTLNYNIPNSWWTLTLDAGYQYMVKIHGKDSTNTREVILSNNGSPFNETTRKLNNAYHIDTQIIQIRGTLTYDF